MPLNLRMYHYLQHGEAPQRRYTPLSTQPTSRPMTFQDKLTAALARLTSCRK